MNHKQKWRPCTGRRKSHYESVTSIPQRTLNVKTSMPPILFYQDELSPWTPRQEHGWIDGGLCPFHTDAHVGSFKVNMDSGAFKCFSCGAAGGDVITFYRLKYACDFMTALADLESRIGL
jgi:hypothetical protein